MSEPFDDTNDFLNILRYCLRGEPLPIALIKQVEWRKIFAISSRQAVVGILLKGVESMMEAGNVIPHDILYHWIAYSQQIEGQNRLVNQRCAELIEKLAKDGYDSCILKGQGNATYYPDPYTRTPGDIDAWVKSKSNARCKKDDVRRVIEYVRKRNPSAVACNIHVEYGDFGGVEVEIHYRPAILHNPFYNKRLTSWVRSQEESVFGNSCLLPSGEQICVPTVEFNIVYQLTHMYKHVMLEGLGLRQVIDYFYLLLNAKDEVRSKMADMRETLKYLNLYNFAGAIMYILRDVLGLEEKYLIVPIDKRRGEFLLKEIIRGGNFGKYDTKGYIVKWKNPVGSWLRHLEYDVRLVRYFPSESLWEPFSRIYQHFWRLAH